MQLVKLFDWCLLTGAERLKWEGEHACDLEELNVENMRMRDKMQSGEQCVGEGGGSRKEQFNMALSNQGNY